MQWSKSLTCPHCQYEATYTGNAYGDSTVHGKHGAFYGTGQRMTRQHQYGPEEVATMWGCPACCMTFIEKHK